MNILQGHMCLNIMFYSVLKCITKFCLTVIYFVRTSICITKVIYIIVSHFRLDTYVILYTAVVRYISSLIKNEMKQKITY